MEEIALQQKAEILIESLQYIKKFHRKIVVIKYGGHAMVDEEAKKTIIQDIALLKYVGMLPVIVHGGGPAINELLLLKGIQSEFYQGLRITDQASMEVVEMALTGQIAPQITADLNAFDVKAVSISGKDAQMMQADYLDEKLGLVGNITHIQPDYLLNLLADDYVPVVSPIAFGPNGQSLNINSDEAAWQIAKALNASKLILVTDVDGVMADPHEPSTLIPQVDVARIDELIEAGIIRGGMIPKLLACTQAVQGGVERCHIINGTIQHALIFELFTEQGIGTMVKQSL